MGVVTEAGGCGDRQVTREVVVMRSDGCRLRERRCLLRGGDFWVTIGCSSSAHCAWRCACVESCTHVRQAFRLVSRGPAVPRHPLSFLLVSPKLHSIFAVTSTYLTGVTLTFFGEKYHSDFFSIKIIICTEEGEKKTRKILYLLRIRDQSIFKVITR